MARAVVMTTVFNGARFVDRYCGNVADSADQDLNWLLVDDGSTDGTPDLTAVRLSELGLTDRVRIETPGRLGRPKALNHALGKVDAPFVFNHDFDDNSFPLRFPAQIAALEAEPALGCVGGGYAHVWADEQEREETRSLDFDFERLRAHFPLYVPFPHTFMAFRTEAVRAVGGYPDWDDYEEMGLLARLMQGGWRIGAVNAIVGRHYVYASSYFESQRPWAARRYRAFRRQLSMRREFDFIRPGRLAMTSRFAYGFLPGPLKSWVRRAIGYAR